MERQEVAAFRSLSTLHPFNVKEFLLRVGEKLQQPASLSLNASDDFTLKSPRHQIVCAIRAHKASSCSATISNSIFTREILDIKYKQLGEYSHPSVPNLQ